MHTALKIPAPTQSPSAPSRSASPKSASSTFLEAAARELGTAPQRVKHFRSRLLTLLVACCTGLGSWIVYLAVTMPSDYRSRGWSAAWVGFDILLLLALTGTFVAAMLRRQIVVLLAVFTATLLLCDAWFDIVLDWGTTDVWGSLASAVFVEVPLAAFLLFRARKLVRMALRRRWLELGLPGDPPPLYRIPLFFSSETVETPVSVPEAAATAAATSGE